ncbi:MAG: glutamine--fructose-6-phosphate transaminase (isomerizing) [Clostridia bacterium]|nr:glutamine--fructose-6-phosphate transaminase (isomerizing) [Clostridia bacterium]
MCGIIGYVGKNDANSVLIDGLRKLEYRGYDSCGIATISNNQLQVMKTVNRIDSLVPCTQKLGTSNIGIGHTRWATHGGASEKNAHPHVDNSDRFVVVHNGIIENYLELRKELALQGYKFYSETDTEVIPNLIAMNYDGNLLEALKKTTNVLEGSYALGVIDTKEPEVLVATKKNSPLIVGLGENENFIASDFSAVLKYTDAVSILDNNDFVVLTKEDVKFYDRNLNLKQNAVKYIDTNDGDIEKNGYEHFMLKEINENTITVKKTLDSYLDGEEIKFNLNIKPKEFKNIKHIHIVACGTAMHAGLNAKYVIEKLTRIPVNVEVASEFRYKNPILDKDDLAIFISQSGETADTLACLELVKQEGIKHISFVNVKDSTMDNLSENVLYTKAGPEIAVASTKAYIAQIMLLDLFAIYLAKINKSYDEEKLNDMLKSAIEIPNAIQEVLENDEIYQNYAERISYTSDMFYLGRGLDYYVALEGSLKLKEISYIHSEAMPFGELKHGSIALIEEGTPAIAIATDKKMIDKTVSNIKEIKARGADVMAITTIKDFPEDVVDEIIYLPEVNEIFSPLVSTIPLQLIAYHVTVEKGLDVDKPRNLAKSVTVE